MNVTKLEDICDVFVGVSRFSTELNSKNINKYYLYRQNIDVDSLIVTNNNFNYQECFFSKEIENKNIIKPGDIIVKLLAPFKFILIEKPIDKLLVPTQYAILRIKNKEKNDPIKLWVYLNLFANKQTQKFIQNTLVVTSIKSTDIKNIAIDLSKLNHKKVNLFYKVKMLDELYSKKKKLLNNLLITLERSK